MGNENNNFRSWCNEKLFLFRGGRFNKSSLNIFKVQHHQKSVNYKLQNRKNITERMTSYVDLTFAH